MNRRQERGGEMKEDDKRKIAEIKADMKCRKNFGCEDSGFLGICKARDAGIEKFLDCLDEDNRVGCLFSLPFGDGYLCSCPLRVYIGKNLENQREGKDRPEIDPGYRREFGGQSDF